jgi:hypothetical protein
VLKKYPCEMGEVTHTRYPSIWDTEAGESQV